MSTPSNQKPTYKSKYYFFPTQNLLDWTTSQNEQMEIQILLFIILIGVKIRKCNVSETISIKCIEPKQQFLGYKEYFANSSSILSVVNDQLKKWSTLTTS
jgi:hypothetical protein